MATLPQLIEDDIQRLDEALREFLISADATAALVIDKGGFLITQIHRDEPKVSPTRQLRLAPRNTDDIPARREKGFNSGYAYESARSRHQNLISCAHCFSPYLFISIPAQTFTFDSENIEICLSALPDWQSVTPNLVSPAVVR